MTGRLAKALAGTPDPVSMLLGIMGTPQGQKAATDIAGAMAAPAKRAAAMFGYLPEGYRWMGPSSWDDGMAKTLRESGNERAAQEYDARVRAGEKEMSDWTEGAALGFAGSITPKVSPMMGIRAYHGSPHDFDKFSMSKIGTGEGAQVYGHGLYFAENPAVANQYRTALTKGGDLEGLAGDFVMRNGGPEKAVAEIDRLAKGWKSGKADALAPRFAADLKAAITSGTYRGRTYEVNIRANPNEFLDWDKPLSAQPAGVQAAMGDLYKGGSPRYIESKIGDGYMPPIFRDFAGQHGAAGASERLRDAGIPGIRYLDQGSRGISQQAIDAQKAVDYWRSVGDADKLAKAERSLAKLMEFETKGTSNYVLFRDDIIDILRKYGVFGAPAVADKPEDRLKRAMLK